MTDQPTRVSADAAVGANAARVAVDVHPVRVDVAGDAFLTLLDGAEVRLPAAGMAGSGQIGDRAIRCLTAEQQRVAHSGYAPLRLCDEHDLQLLASVLADRSAGEERA